MHLKELQNKIQHLQETRGASKKKATQIVQGVTHLLAKKGAYASLNEQIKNGMYKLPTKEGTYSYEVDTSCGSVRIQVADNSLARIHAEYYGYYIQELVDECIALNPDIEITPTIMNDIFEVSLHKWQFLATRKFLD